MALISTITTSETIGREGMVATTDPNMKMRIAHATATELVFGRAVIRGSHDNAVVHPSGTTGVFAGVVMEDLGISAYLQATPNTVPVGYDAQIMTSGQIWVIPEVDVTQDNPVYFRHANAGSAPEALGRFRDDNDGGSGDVTLIAGAKWATSATAGNPARLEINIP